MWVPLAEFDAILRWNTLEVPQKLEAYDLIENKNESENSIKMQR